MRKEKNVNPVVVAVVVLVVVGLAVLMWMRYSTPSKPGDAELISPTRLGNLQPEQIKAGERVVKEHMPKPATDSR